MRSCTLPSIQPEETSLHGELCLQPRQHTRTLAHFPALVLSLNFLESLPSPLYLERKQKAPASFIASTLGRKL